VGRNHRARTACVAFCAPRRAEDPGVDIVVSDNPATCPAHLAYIADVARVDDLDTTVAARPVYAFSVLGLARDRLEPAAHLLMDHGVQIMLYAEPAHGAYGSSSTRQESRNGAGSTPIADSRASTPRRCSLVGDGDNDVAMLTPCRGRGGGEGRYDQHPRGSGPCHRPPALPRMGIAARPHRAALTQGRETPTVAGSSAS
jgi:hypothetical protein